jgi:hypothetical protein
VPQGSGLAVGLSVAGAICLVVVLVIFLWIRWRRGHHSTKSAVSYVVEAQSNDYEDVSDSDWDVPCDPVGNDLWSRGGGSWNGTFHPLSVEEGIGN